MIQVGSIMTDHNGTHPKAAEVFANEITHSLA
jgi:hypothetical protein